MDDKITALEMRARDLQKDIVEEYFKMGKYQHNYLQIDINEKGRGVFAKKLLKKGDFVCYYEGNLISKKEGLRRVMPVSVTIGALICM